MRVLGRWVGWGALEEGFEAFDGFGLAGGFAGEVEDAVFLSGGEASGGVFPGDTGFAVAGGGFEQGEVCVGEGVGEERWRRAESKSVGEEQRRSAKSKRTGEAHGRMRRKLRGSLQVTTRISRPVVGWLGGRSNVRPFRTKNCNLPAARHRPDRRTAQHSSSR